MRTRRFAPSLVITMALAPACASHDKPGPLDGNPPSPDRERSWTEFRNGLCEVIPDCSPPAGTNINPCNPPPPRQVVDCPVAILPTQPPGTTVTRNDDGTCWVECDATTCHEPSPLRVRCPVDGAAPPDYATALVPSTTAGAPPTVAAGIVPVQSQRGEGCFYGTQAVSCPPRFHTWH